MQFASFDLEDPIFELFGLRLSVQLVTLENLYGVDRDRAERGFAALCEGARELGFHLMPMFGIHCANAWLPRFRNLAASVYMKSATGNRFHGNLPDWDLARAHDTGWQAWLNPGHPAWREALAEQIEALAARHPFDAVFLDTTEVCTNDPDHPVYDGIRSLVQRLRSTLPGRLLAGEYDYDALIALFPLFQRAWWTSAPPWTRRYLRRFGHLCEREPEGRTGVHLNTRRIRETLWTLATRNHGASGPATLSTRAGTYL